MDHYRLARMHGHDLTREADRARLAGNGHGPGGPVRRGLTLARKLMHAAGGWHGAAGPSAAPPARRTRGWTSMESSGAVGRTR